MKVVLLAAVAVSALASSPGTDTSAFRYERPLTMPAVTGRACAVLDANVFAHANSQALDDLRVYRKDDEGRFLDVPFHLSVSDTQTTEDDIVPAANFHEGNGQMDFDLHMPPRPYSSVALDIKAKDFLGTAIATGSMTPDGPRTMLGTFPVADLTAQGLSRSTTLPLEENTFPLLHVQLRLHNSAGTTKSITPSLVRGAVVPPSRQAQRVYSVVATTDGFHREGDDSVAVLHLPQDVPAERVRVALSPEFHGSFQRDVEIFAAQDEAAAAGEFVKGTISRMEIAPSSAEPMPMDSQTLAIETAFAANFKAGATIRVVVHNGGQPPLPLRAAYVEMRQRQICFDAVQGAPYMTLYGGADGAAERDFASLRSDGPSLAATLGPEVANPDFKIRKRSPGVLARQPDLLWVCSAGVLAILGSVVLRRRRSRRP